MSVTVHGVSVSLGSEADDDNNARKQDHDATLMVREWHDLRTEELVWPKPAEIHSEKLYIFIFKPPYWLDF